MAKKGKSPSPFWQPSKKGERLLALICKTLFCCSLLWGYIEFTTSLDKAGGVGVAVVFILIETVWTTIAHEDPKTGSVRVEGWKGKLGHSSFAQFWSNVVWGSMMLFRYREIMAYAEGVIGIGKNIGYGLRIAAFPFNIWWLEIIEGYIIMFLFGKNVAWEYRGKAAFFHGNITLEYYAPWLGLGLVLELIWEGVILSLLKAVERSGAWVWIIAFASIVTILFAPQMSAKAIFRSIVGPKKRLLRGYVEVEVDDDGDEEEEEEEKNEDLGRTRSRSRKKKMGIDDDEIETKVEKKKKKVVKRGRSRKARGKRS